MDTPVRSRHTLLALALLCAAIPLRAQDSVQIPVPVPVSIVPHLRGLTVEDARARLAEHELGVGALDEVVAPGTPGTVARQQPDPGTKVAPGSSIPLWLVAAEVTVMPAVMGLPPERALRMIRRAGLRQGEISGWQTQGPIRVIGHTFRAGERVPANAVVNLSLGIPPVRTVARADTPRTTVVKVDSGAVPDVRTLGLLAARARLDSAGLAATFDSVFADSAGWTVATQSPGAGALVPAGSFVQLAFAPPPPPVAGLVEPPRVPSTLQPSTVSPPAPPPAEPSRVGLWIAAAVLLVIAAGATGQRMRARGKAVPPITGVRVGLRADEARSRIDGPPLGLPRLKLRLRSGGAGRSRIAIERPLFRAKGGAG
ncbi:MAG TPA: PASTA domain-containing protein [Longimicrobium sp.]|nr:PASTA domain-containing protein [Longimicrobium sp.]